MPSPFFCPVNCVNVRETKPRLKKKSNGQMQNAVIFRLFPQKINKKGLKVSQGKFVLIQLLKFWKNKKNNLIAESSICWP